MIETTHDRCTTCDWLGREAKRTAIQQGTDHWTSETQTMNGSVTHVAHYLAEADPTEKNGDPR